MTYDPLGNSDWRAWQASRQVQAVVRECEDLGGRPHRLSEDAVQDGHLPSDYHDWRSRQAARLRGNGGEP